jgi:hypothetical protein
MCTVLLPLGVNPIAVKKIYVYLCLQRLVDIFNEVMKFKEPKFVMPSSEVISSLTGFGESGSL